MHKSKFHFCCIFIFHFHFLFAQTDDLKKLSKQNNIGSNTNTNRNNRNSRDNSFQNTLILFQLFQYSYQSIASFFQYQKFLINSRQESNPRIKSIDLLPQLGTSFAYPSAVPTPEIRANWGLISTQIRYFYLHEFNRGNYATLDWQVLQFNLISKFNTYLRLGIGFSRDMYLKENFTEFGLNSDFKLSEKISCVLQGRYAPNFSGTNAFRTEFGIQLAYKLNERENGRTFITTGYMYQNYWQSINFHYASIGLILTIW